MMICDPHEIWKETFYVDQDSINPEARQSKEPVKATGTDGIERIGFLYSMEWHEGMPENTIQLGMYLVQRDGKGFEETCKSEDPT